MALRLARVHAKWPEVQQLDRPTLEDLPTEESITDMTLITSEEAAALQRNFTIESELLVQFCQRCCASVTMVYIWTASDAGKLGRRTVQRQIMY